jgi:uncharacterized protein YukE
MLKVLLIVCLAGAVLAGDDSSSSEEFNERVQNVVAAGRERLNQMGDWLSGAAKDAGAAVQSGYNRARESGSELFNSAAENVNELAENARRQLDDD